MYFIVQFLQNINPDVRPNIRRTLILLGSVILPISFIVESGVKHNNPNPLCACEFGSGKMMHTKCLYNIAYINRGKLTFFFNDKLYLIKLYCVRLSISVIRTYSISGNRH
jgi:hypothetical protein